MRNRFPRLSIERLESRALYAADIGLGEIQLFSDPIEAQIDDVPAEVAVVSDVDAALTQNNILPAPVSTLPQLRDQSVAGQLEEVETFSSPERIADFSVQTDESRELLIADDLTQDSRSTIEIEDFEDSNTEDTDSELTPFAQEALAS